MKSVFVVSGFFIAFEIFLGIQEALTFDKHFVQAGFKALTMD